MEENILLPKIKYFGKALLHFKVGLKTFHIDKVTVKESLVGDCMSHQTVQKEGQDHFDRFALRVYAPVQCPS